MADKLIVKDFGPIRDAEMDIKKTTVLIGPQGSGKSTLAKLVAICRDKDHWSLNSLETFPPNFFDYGIQNYGIGTSQFEYYSDKVHHHYKNGITRRTFKTSGWGKYLREEKSTVSDTASWSTLLLGIKTPIYIPAERVFFPMVAEAILGLLTQKVAIPNFVLEFGREYELARKNIMKLPVDYLNIEYKYEGGRDYIFFNKSGSVLLSESASGFQSIIPMKLVIENSKEIKHKFIIEEPELNLYPTTQKSLIYYLADRCTKSENELMMTTHSPYVLAALNNLIFAYKVANEKPEQAEEVEKVIPRHSWLNPDEFAAYFVADGTVRSIINPKTGLISENELDSVSDEIGDEFDTLMGIYRSKKE